MLQQSSPESKVSGFHSTFHHEVSMFLRSILCVTALAITAACADSGHPVAPEPGIPALSASGGPHFFELDWPGATAMCGEPLGNIQFSGFIQGIDHTTVDGTGNVHRTRVWRVRNIQGVNLKTGTQYTVVGGAEMLTWHTHLGQVPGVVGKSIHAGTLVFQPNGGGAPVIAHHSVRYFADHEGEPRMDFHSWRCVHGGR
jgi:hypothetical protein